jgi:hypothetical protein
LILAIHDEVDALNLGRARRSVLVVGRGGPRHTNSPPSGCAVDEHGYVRVDAMKRTTVPDVPR